MCEALPLDGLASAPAATMQPGKLVVRSAIRADAPAVKVVLRDTFETTWRPQLTAAALERCLLTDHVARYVDAQIEAFTVAELDGDVVGMVHWSDDFIEALHVCGDRRRLGIGRRLIEHAEQDIRRAGFGGARLETDTFNTGSRSFYAALGYVEIDRYPDTEWDSGFTTILLAKRF